MRIQRASLRALLRLCLLATSLPARAEQEIRSPAEEDRIVERLEADPCTVVKEDGAGGGVTGARKLVLRFSDGEEILVKWKPVPGGMDGWNNSPRKEIAAYQVQRLFLDPADHVVPTTVLRCLELDAFTLTGSKVAPNVEGARCVLGEVEVWVHDAHIPDHIYDPELFERDSAYATHMADMNLLTYLIRHQDGRASNFLLANDPENRRVFSIDNGIAFGASLHNFFVKNWDTVRVPALRKKSVERLRTLPPGAFEPLAVVVELKRDEAGVLRPAARSPSRHPDEGIYLGDGALQLGLTAEEIADLGERRESLLEQVDAGRLRTF